jgi:hypothetical protein
VPPLEKMKLSVNGDAEFSPVSMNWKVWPTFSRKK